MQQTHINKQQTRSVATKMKSKSTVTASRFAGLVPLEFALVFIVQSLLKKAGSK
jgi:hypothetical protein